MTIRMKIASLIVVGSIAAASLILPLQARASEEGRRNTALALGAATAYFILNKRPVEALIGAGATAYAAKLLQDDINKRHRRERAAAYYSGRRYASSSSSSYYRAGNSVSYRAGSTMRSTKKRAIVSSAYRKGLEAGYRQGYRDGLAEGVRIGANRQQTNTRMQPSNVVGSIYDRIRASRG